MIRVYKEYLEKDDKYAIVLYIPLNSKVLKILLRGEKGKDPNFYKFKDMTYEEWDKIKWKFENRGTYLVVYDFRGTKGLAGYAWRRFNELLNEYKAYPIQKSVVLVPSEKGAREIRGFLEACGARVRIFKVEEVM